MQMPEGSVEIQTGLYLYQYNQTIGGIEYTFSRLYSSDGYCFYDAEAEIYDEEGNVIPADEIQPNQRVYMQYMALAVGDWATEQLNARYVSVPVDPSYEIVSVSTPTEEI